MAKIIKERRRVEKVDYSREFHWKNMLDCGFSFPCDKEGKLKGDLTDIAKKNYKSCLNDANLHDDGIVTHHWSYYENAIFQCDCGRVFELYDDYMGACGCPSCHQWYNLFGQKLNPRETWKEGEDW